MQFFSFTLFAMIFLKWKSNAEYSEWFEKNLIYQDRWLKNITLAKKHSICNLLLEMKTC